MTIDNGIFERACSDPEFRGRLLRDPSAVLAEGGAKLPPNAVIEVIDVGRNEIHLNLGRQCAAPQLQKIFERAESDATFRAELFAKPKSVLEKSLGETIPANVAVRVHDRPRAGVIRLFVPPLRGAAGDELSDAELAGVAGGGHFKNLMIGIGNWLCRDTIAAEINNTTGTYTVVTNPSPGGNITESGSLMIW